MSTIFNLMAFFSIEDSIFSDLKANYPFAFWIAIAAAGGGYLTYKVMKFLSRFESLVLKVNGIENAVNTLIIRVDNLETRVGFIERQLSTIIGLLAGRGFDVSALPANSPREFSELGYRMLRDLGCKDYVDRNREEFIRIMESKNLKLGFQVQNCALSMILERTLDDDFAPIQSYIFQNSFYPKGDGTMMALELKDAIHLAGIYLRDLYFQKYPETKI